MQLLKKDSQKTVIINSLVYVNRKVTPLSEAKIFNPLVQSIENNRRIEVTGILLYKNIHLMHFKKVKKLLLEKLKNITDKYNRHHEVKIGLEGEKSKRDFENSSMTFYKLYDKEKNPVEGHSEFRDMSLADEVLL